MIYSNTQENIPDFKRNPFPLAKHLFQSGTKLSYFTAYSESTEHHCSDVC